MARRRPPLPVRRLHGPTQPTGIHHHQDQKDHTKKDQPTHGLRYGIVALTREVSIPQKCGGMDYGK